MASLGQDAKEKKEKKEKKKKKEPRSSRRRDLLVLSREEGNI